MLSHVAIRWAFVLVRCTLEYCAGVAGVAVVAGGFETEKVS